ncbi:MAG: hypothetical protein PHN89_04835 [Candidatus Pacebacteria bacterium]|nr:hypothetical protein [Candidatus Paceibacterota bacterium]
MKEKETTKEKSVFEEYEHVSNSDLLAEYTQVVIAGENCLRARHIDAHGHFHHSKELYEVIKSRMTSPEIIRLKVKTS